MNGYQIIQEVADRSGGVWKPSPGSIYPTLQQLEDEGLVTADAATGRRTFTLTDEGRAYVAEHADEVSAPWEAMSAPADDDENGHEADPRAGGDGDVADHGRGHSRAAGQGTRGR